MYRKTKIAHLNDYHKSSIKKMCPFAFNLGPIERYFLLIPAVFLSRSEKYLVLKMNP